jgi:DNA-binding transcriptional ArsR family regulator
MAQPPACKWCWGVRFAQPLSGRLGSHGWNQLVTQVSGGYLYGREVRRPLEEVPREDRPDLWTYVREPEERAGVLRLALEGLGAQEIAGELGVSVDSVKHHLRRLRREHGVARTAELREKLGKRLKSGGEGVGRQANAG